MRVFWLCQQHCFANVRVRLYQCYWRCHVVHVRVWFGLARFDWSVSVKLNHDHRLLHHCCTFIFISDADAAYTRTNNSFFLISIIHMRYIPGIWYVCTACMDQIEWFHIWMEWFGLHICTALAYIMYGSCKLVTNTYACTLTCM